MVAAEPAHTKVGVAAKPTGIGEAVMVMAAVELPQAFVPVTE